MAQNQVFVYTFNRIVDQLITDVNVALPVDVKMIPNPADVQGKLRRRALWDTGASHTCISARLAQELDLPVIGRTQTQTAAGLIEVDRYMCSLYLLPSEVSFAVLPVSQFDQGNGDFDILLGMDIVKRGDFAVSHFEGHTRMSFRVPSRTHADLRTVGDPTMNSVNRNAPCPCGSGLKFKKCCQNSVVSR